MNVIEEHQSPSTKGDLKVSLDLCVEKAKEDGGRKSGMAMAALSAMNYVGAKIDADPIESRAALCEAIAIQRNMTIPHVIDIGSLLYPQYCNDDAIPGYKVYLQNEYFRAMLRNKADELLKSGEANVSEQVRQHWKWLLTLTPLNRTATQMAPTHI